MRSKRSSTDFLPSFRLTQTTIPATARAAIVSALASHGRSKCCAARTPTSPKSTTHDDQISVEKCKASASRAWLWYFFDTRSKAREREKSTTIESMTTRNAHGLGSTSIGSWKKSRREAS